MIWQPIATAPKDGTVFLAFYGHRRCGPSVGAMQWATWETDTKNRRFQSWTTLTESESATHWRPMPETLSDLVEVVDRNLGMRQRQVLGILFDTKEPMSVWDMCQCLGLGRDRDATLRQTTSTLERLGYIRKHPLAISSTWVLTEAGTARLVAERASE